jgi:TRAP transporter TAXI family solute receptor
MKKIQQFAMFFVLFALLLSACGGAATSTQPAATELPATEVMATEAAATEAPVTSEQEICTPELTNAGSDTELIIGTGGTGGVFYPFGEGLANILTANMPGVTTTFIETGGSVDNIKMVDKGEIQIGFSTVDSAYDAILGQGAYADIGAMRVCALAVLYNSFVHVVASEASGITSVADMKGRIVSVGDSGSSTEGAADRVLEAAGLDPQVDITRQNLSIADATAAMSAGSIDAFFWIGGLPTKAVSDMLAAGTKVKFVDASEYVGPLMEEYGPVYTTHILGRDVYGTEADVPGIGIGNILFVNQNMSEDQAYQILTVIFDHLDEVHALHPQAANLTVENAAGGSSIPLHPGAITFFRDRGVIQ